MASLRRLYQHYALYMRSLPIHVVVGDPSHFDAYVVNAGFTDFDGHQQKKPGLVANHSGAVAAWVFGANTVARHARLGQLHISHLASYEHMGMLELELRAREPDAEISAYDEWRARWSGAEPCREHVAASDDWSTGELLATATVNCTWESRVSETVVYDMLFNKTQAHGRCLVLVARAQQSPQGSMVNIQHISLF